MSNQNTQANATTFVACIDSLNIPSEDKMNIFNLLARLNQQSPLSYAHCLKAKSLFTMPPDVFLDFAQRYATEELGYTRTSFAGNQVDSQRLPSPIQVITAMELFKKLHDLDATERVMIIPAQMKKQEDFLVYAVVGRYVIVIVLFLFVISYKYILLFAVYPFCSCLSIKNSRERRDNGLDVSNAPSIPSWRVDA